MAKLLSVTRRAFFSSNPSPRSLLYKFSASFFCSETIRSLSTDRDPLASSPSVKLPPIVPSGGDRLDAGFRIELVDTPIWGFSSWSGIDLASETPILDENDGSSPAADEPPDFDAIDELRLQKRLFYKLDKGSKEFEENNFSLFHRKSEKRKKKKSLDKISKEERKKVEKKPQNLKDPKPTAAAKVPDRNRESYLASTAMTETTKEKRKPTFNQLTDPYHLPFCLDIFVTKGSVRACIVHRITSKVVAVAHSISKDMKFDLKSRKDTVACAAVGGVLAQRAIEDDIHNVVYTPRKGERIEGKILVVLQSITDNGVDVKVKLKQNRHGKKISIPQENEA